MQKEWQLCVRLYIDLKQKVLNWLYVKIMGVQRVVKTGIFPSLEIGTNFMVYRDRIEAKFLYF